MHYPTWNLKKTGKMKSLEIKDNLHFLDDLDHIFILQQMFLHPSTNPSQTQPYTSICILLCGSQQSKHTRVLQVMEEQSYLVVTNYKIAK
jgi:hypothetical protein